MSNLIPLEDHIILEPYKEESKTASGIVLPDTNKEKPGKWKVIAVGEWKILENWKRASMDVKIGDVVYFTKYSPDEIEVEIWWEKKKYLVIKQASILAKQGK